MNKSDLPDLPVIILYYDIERMFYDSRFCGTIYTFNTIEEIETKLIKDSIDDTKFYYIINSLSDLRDYAEEEYNQINSFYKRAVAQFKKNGSHKKFLETFEKIDYGCSTIKLFYGELAFDVLYFMKEYR